MSGNGVNLSFEYNGNGVRTAKTANGVRHTYYLKGADIQSEVISGGGQDKVITYLYDGTGSVCGLSVNGSDYYYIKNLQGDIVKIVDSKGDIVVQYGYNAWGKVLYVRDGSGNDISGNAEHIGNVNPYRYRSYYYDTQTGLYYLNTRYYDPEICRFINADEPQILLGQDSFDLNLFAYCNNDPVNAYDPFGLTTMALKIIGGVKVGKALVAGIKVVAVIAVVVLVVVGILLLLRIISTADLRSAGRNIANWFAWLSTLLRDGIAFAIDRILSSARGVAGRIAGRSGALRRRLQEALMFLFAETTRRAITINGITYNCDTIAEDIVGSMPRQGHIYYPAIRANNAVWVSVTPIDVETAKAILRLNDDRKGVFAVDNSRARGIVGPNPIGPERHGYSGHWPHYHPRAHRRAHCWFIG